MTTHAASNKTPRLSGRLGIFAAIALLGLAQPVHADEKPMEVSSLTQLAQAAAGNGQAIRMTPGVYKMSDYLIDAVITKIREGVPPGPGRPPVWILNFSGSGNHFDFTGVDIEIATDLYAKLPSGYTRCLFVSGSNNTIDGLTVHNAGKDIGSNGNTLSVWGENNTVQNVTLRVFGSFPHGYGDLLGKGGPNIVHPLLKQSGMMIGGVGNTVRRCKVISRALGHCYYVQNAKRTCIEDCYAEGEMRSTTDMLRDISGPAFDLGFRSVYENRDGRYLITPGYTKSLCEDGFRTYGGVSQTTIRRCTAVNTRAGFEIGGQDQDADKTVVEDCTATGCERAYLLGSNVVVRGSRGDTAYGPLLYLRGGKDSDVELQLCGNGPESMVHELATIAGSNHRIKLRAGTVGKAIPHLPILLGFGMPKDAEMSTPVLPASAQKIHLINEITEVPVIRGAEAVEDCFVESKGAVLADKDTKLAPK